MNNAEKFKQIFGLYATELWSMPEGDFLAWLNRDVETTQIDHTADVSKKVSIPCAHENDLIFRQAAIDTAIEAADKWDGGYSSEREGIIRKFFDKVPAVQPDHVADIGKKVSISCGQENDLISRQMAIDTIIGQPPEPHYPSWYAAQIEILPAAQPATNCSEIPNGSDDTISRRAAIDAMKDMYRAAEKWLRDATDDVTKARAESCMASLVEIKLRTEKLPSVQPDHVADSGKKVDGDCISRQAAIDAVDEQIEQCNKALGSFDISPKDEYAIKVERASLKAYKEQLENMSSAQPEIIRCKDCDWWTKQEDSVQGRCELMQMYPAGGWYCGNARRRLE